MMIEEKRCSIFGHRKIAYSEELEKSLKRLLVFVVVLIFFKIAIID